MCRVMLARSAPQTTMSKPDDDHVDKPREFNKIPGKPPWTGQECPRPQHSVWPGREQLACIRTWPCNELRQYHPELPSSKLNYRGYGSEANLRSCSLDHRPAHARCSIVLSSALNLVQEIMPHLKAFMHRLQDPEDVQLQWWLAALLLIWESVFTALVISKVPCALAQTSSCVLA